MGDEEELVHRLMEKPHGSHINIVARLERLEAQVRELQGHRHVLGMTYPPGIEQNDNVDLPEPHEVTTADLARPEARAALATAAEAHGVLAQEILDEADND